MDFRDLIAIQDMEYEESLANDRKKEEIKERDERERKRRRKEIEENILLKKEKLLINRDGELINIKFQLPEKSITRIFTSNDSLSDLYDFIYIQDIHPNFEIYTSHPKRLLENNNSKLHENNINDRSKLYIYFNNL